MRFDSESNSQIKIRDQEKGMEEYPNLDMLKVLCYGSMPKPWKELGETLKMEMLKSNTHLE